MALHAGLARSNKGKRVECFTCRKDSESLGKVLEAARMAHVVEMKLGGDAGPKEHVSQVSTHRSGPNPELDKELQGVTWLPFSLPWPLSALGVGIILPGPLPAGLYAPRASVC